MSIRRGLPPGMWDSCTVLCQHFHAERQAGPAQERVFGWMAVTVAVVDGGGGGCGVDELRIDRFKGGAAAAAGAVFGGLARTRHKVALPR